ncbi:MAG: hypothetical protein H6825_13985 [Planctomycetes bacterium]|nr:hypothetical protein [Planctomycetota bacterium]
MGYQRESCAIFISARTEEMSWERHAAYHAIRRAGLFPLTFDTALNELSDRALPQAPPRRADYVRSSGTRCIADQVDALLDASRFFVGVYGESMGLPDYTLGWLTWLEYEFLRFVSARLQAMAWPRSDVAGFLDGLPREARMLFASPERRPGEQRPRAELLSECLRIHAYVHWLRDVLAGQGTKWVVDKVQAILQLDMLFLVKKPTDRDYAPSRDLAEFLGGLRCRTPTVRTHRAPWAKNHQRYRPAHLQVFSAVLARGREWLQQHHKERAEQAVRNQASQEPRAPSSEVVRFEISPRLPVANPPAVLYRLLRVLLLEGLDVRRLCADWGDEQGHRFVVCEAVSYDTAGIMPRSSAPVQDALRNGLGLPEADFAIRILDAKQVDARMPTRSSHGTSSRQCMLHFVDVPGILWAAVSLVTAHHGNIVSLDARATPDVPALHSASATCVIFFEMAESLASPPPDPELEYELGCIHGMLGVSLGPPEQARGGLP